MVSLNSSSLVAVFVLTLAVTLSSHVTNATPPSHTVAGVAEGQPWVEAPLNLENDDVQFLTAAQAQELDLPDEVFIKTHSEAFTFTMFFAVRSGRIYAKARTEGAQWSLFGKDGLPHPPFETAPSSVTELSADANDLMVLDDKGRAYYYRLSKEDSIFLYKGWQNGFGRGPLPKHVQIPGDRTDWQVAQRGLESGWWTDIVGHNHSTSIGCDSLVMAKDAEIYLMDNWSLPDLYAFQICTPHRGRFLMEAMDDSGSVLFVIGQSGEMFTRLADFDILGFDPIKKYTYDVNCKDQDDLYVLPPFDWSEQPRITPDMGRITSNITIFQTGKGNDARELRVLGVNSQGESGYFSKGVADASWTFTTVPSFGHIDGPFLANDGNTRLAPVKDQDFKGPSDIKSTKYGGYRLKVSLLSFQPHCSPATIQLEISDLNSTPSSKSTHSITLHHHFYWPKSAELSWAEVMAPSSMTTSTDKLVQGVAKDIFGGKDHFPVTAFAKSHSGSPDTIESIELRPLVSGPSMHWTFN
eukprot:GFYU01008293.1.p1 GENE.GFYU01008293.1~~GFYU01008293.1.p1  ORF type:complete len:524 (+),score=125.91 GFYU01008293.1:124-1695(+)